MFGIGFGEMVVIAVLLLVAVGPDKLPTMIKTVAKTYRQFRRAANDIRASTGIDDLLRDEELKELAELRKQKLLAMQQKPVAKPLPPKPAVAAATQSAKPMPHAPPPEGDDVPAAPTPFSKELAPAGGLTYKQRTMEMPLDGVDVAEARHALDVSAVPETRAGVSPEAKTLAASGAVTKPGVLKPTGEA